MEVVRNTSSVVERNKKLSVRAEIQWNLRRKKDSFGCKYIINTSIANFVLVGEYDYNKLDFTRDDNKLACVGDIRINIIEEENIFDYTFALHNTTEKTFQDVKVYLFIKNDAGN